MGRAPCCAKVGLHRGPWTPQEDSLLINYIRAHGEGLWRSLPKKAGLLRCGKSCRLRWLNYLRPDIKRGNIAPDEDDLIIRLHALLGNKWSLIAGRLPGRTDNEIKNYWNTHLSKKLRSEGTDPNTHKKLVRVPPKRKRSRSNTKKEKTGNDRPHVHIPKPVRVTSLTSLNSLASFESSVTREGSATPYDGGGVRFLRGCGADDDLPGVTVHPLASDLDKLYEEYLQLLNSDDDLDHNQARELDCFAQSLLV